MIKLLNYKATKVVAIILSLILPIVTCVSLFSFIPDNAFFDFISLNVYNFLWCGFYGSLLTFFAFKSKWQKAFVIIINLVSYGFFALGSLMGGIAGPFILLLKAVIPFLPIHLIF